MHDSTFRGAGPGLSRVATLLAGAAVCISTGAAWGQITEADIEAMRKRGVQTKPYLPAIHLMAYYREVHGYRAGQFPVCEDVAARSIALPFFPELGEGEVEQVVAALRSVLGRD